MKIKVLNTNQTYEFPNGVCALDVLKEVKLDFTPFAVKANRRLRELTYQLHADCEIEFLSHSARSANRIYEASLRFIVAMAYNRLFKSQVKFNYNVSMSILAIPKKLGRKLTEKDIEALDKEIKKIVKADLPFEKVLIPLEQAENIYAKQGDLDKLAVLNVREQEYVNAYKVGDYYNYMYSKMVPSTGYLKDYKIFLYDAGFILQYPRGEANGRIPEFSESLTYANTLREAAAWSKSVGVGTIAELNEKAFDRKKISEFINMCEIRHTNNFFKVASEILNYGAKKRLICVAGPSSSGKTTFATRLRYTLASLGVKTLMISIDDYYVERSKTPLDEDGNLDFESLYALDIDLFNQNLSDLIQGKPTSLPVYDFKTSSRSFKEPLTIDATTPIIIEGIHALNEELTKSIKRDLKYKIFIGPQTQAHIDFHNPISFTDLRLLRRIVRDSKYRNAKATETLSMWPSVRKGEFKWIYPNQEGVDFVFNTELSYEYAVLKKHALPQLQAIPRSSEYFITANRLVKFLKYYVDIDDQLVPCNSLLREFIGGACV